MQYAGSSLDVSGEHPAVLRGVPAGFDVHVVLDLHSHHKRILWICRDEVQLAEVATALAFLAPGTPVLEIPPWDCHPYSRISPNARIIARRIRTLSTVGRLPTDAPFILLTTVAAAMQVLAPKQVFSRSLYVVRVGRTVETQKLLAYFERIGFSRVTQVLEPGDFAVRGGIIDALPAGQENPVRIDFFGQTIESLREFDITTQRTIKKLQHVTFTAASEVILGQGTIEQFRQNYRQIFGGSASGDLIYTRISAGQKVQGIEQWLPFFYRQTATLLDYVPDAAIVMGEGFADRVESWRKTVQELHDERTQATGRRNGEGSNRACPVEWTTLDPADLIRAIEERPSYQLMPHPVHGEATGPIGKPTVNLAAMQQQGSGALMGELTATLARKRTRSKVLLACRSVGSRERIRNILADEGVTGAVDIDDYAGFAGGASSLGLAVWSLGQGYEFPGMTILSEHDIFGTSKSAHAKRKKTQSKWFHSDDLKPGELLVHADHGIGRYMALETHTINGIGQDFVVLEYADGGKLSIPVENLDLLSRYGDARGKLDRLGSAAWQERQTRLKKQLLEIADDLLNIAAVREVRSAPVMARDEHAWDAFVARFDFQETEDQLAAVEEILADLDSSKPMDRLVCGDVGYGKTEVAMRAAFITVLAGYQVAVLAPTTLLARQHFDTFRRRFRGFPVQVRQLSRLVKPVDAKATVAGMAEGTVDIVVGTHALLGKSIRFRNLGLLVIDEEQNFGVVQKERFKQMRANIHVLTLTATPIPRTLQLALTGIREMSMIQTPPVDRLLIRTYVSTFDPVDVRQALLRELYRGGQSFVVVPRIKDLKSADNYLQTHVPEARFEIANGQMPAADLEERMRRFYDGECNILLSTNIIASGLDIPSANTIIILNANRFGLSQLYQLRGRVGRSHLRAYAYITHPPELKLSENAQSCMRALSAIEALGAGLYLSTQDLDIRGSGNLLGAQQSGHINEVGLELYNKMLEEAILELKQTRSGGDDDPRLDNWIPQLNIGIEARIPEDHIPDTDIRIGLYRRMAHLDTNEGIDEMAIELVDRFGAMPKPLMMFLKILKLRIACKEARIARLDAAGEGIAITFHENTFPAPEALMGYLATLKGVNVQPGGIGIRCSWSSPSSQIAGLYTIVREIASLATEKTGDERQWLKPLEADGVDRVDSGSVVRPTNGCVGSG